MFIRFRPVLSQIQTGLTILISTSSDFIVFDEFDGNSNNILKEMVMSFGAALGCLKDNVSNQADDQIVEVE